MLVGNLLLARWPDIGKTAAIYAVVGGIHWGLRDRFFAITLDPRRAYVSGMKVRFWDFLFYATFGVVITSSVAIAGVLLVFSFLVVPAAIGVMFADRPRPRILIAWSAGATVSVLGIGFTFYEGTLPAGPVVVAAFAAALILAGLVRYLRVAPRKAPAFGRVAAGAAAVALAVSLSVALRKPAQEHGAEHHESEFDQLLAELKTDDEAKLLHAIDHLRESPDVHAVAPLLAVLDRTRSGRVLEHLAETLRRFNDPAAAPGLRRAAVRPEIDAGLRVALADSILSLKEASGLELLIGVFSDEGASKLARTKALALFERWTGRSVGYRFGGDRGPLDRIAAWWKEHGGHMRWRETTGRFE